MAPDKKSLAGGVTLIAVVGISPAILTETIWVLAQGTQRTQSVIPDDVVAITTVRGAQAIKRQLLTTSPDFGGQTVWQTLRRELLGADATGDERLTLRVTVIEQRDPATGTAQPLEDIRNAEDNLAADEFILRQVRDHTSANDRRLIASLAGGRKTMSALLHAAFSHLARPQDRLTHILVNEPYDGSSLKPLFFYPNQPAQTLTGPDGKTYQARNARLELADVPFAPLRVRFPDIAEIPTRFRALVQMYSDIFKRDATKPAVIELLPHPPRVVVDGLPVELESERQLVVVRFLLEANQKQWARKDQIEAAEIFKAWHGYQPELTRVRPALRSTVLALYEKQKAHPGEAWVANASSDDIKRALSYLRRRLEQADASWIPPKRDLRLPPFRTAGHY
jgi:CRISPR-associated protein (TIGR02584 family)